MLADITVLDVGNNIAGPCVATILAGLGANVVKIERPDGGDDSRIAPPFVGRSGVKFGAADPADSDISLAFLKRNRGKRSVTLDLRSPGDQERFHELARTADVLVENFRPGTLGRLGLEPAALMAANPRLIVCSVTGFGQTGPMAGWAAYDTVVRALSGDVGTGRAGGVALADWSAALFGAIGVLGALHHRDEHAEGVHIDVSMLEAWMALAWESNLDVVAPSTRRVAPWNTYPCADGNVFICAYTERQWSNLERAIGLADERFATRFGRIEFEEELDGKIRDWTGPRHRWDIATALQEAGVPSAPVLTPAEVKESPQVVSRGVLDPVGHPDDVVPTPDVHCAQFPIWISGRGHLRYPRSAPALGEANDELLGADANSIK